MSPTHALLEASQRTAGALDRLETWIRQRDILAGPFKRVLGALQVTATADELDGWAQAVIDLANVNVGPTALVTFWQISAQSGRSVGLASLINIAHAAADIGRRAGAAAVRAALEVRLTLSAVLDASSRSTEATWWQAWIRLAREAPACVVGLAPHAARIVTAGGVDGLAEFIAAGLRATGSRGTERLAYFKLEDRRALRHLERLAGTATFTQSKTRMRGFATALWGFAPVVQPAAFGTDQQPMRRTSIAGGIVRVPDVYRGVPADAVASLFAAAVAHATAHLALGSGRFPVGSLKPIQIVLVGLVEDARIEALAMRRFPGLRRLWEPYHVAVTSRVTTAPVLLARLARALFDPAYQDDDGFIAKARALFAAEPDLDDPGLSRRIGNLLGHDFGQMRIQFNAKSFVIEPVYRDDGLGLWDFPEPPDTPPPELEMPAESAKSLPGESERTQKQPPETDPSLGRARAVAADDRGVAVASYPEWDRAAAMERPDWSTVREVAAVPGDPATIETALEREVGLRLRIERLVRGAKIGSRRRLRRQPDGTEFDLDGVVDAAIALRAGEVPDERIHRRTVPFTRDVAVTVLIDTSESTRDQVPSVGTSVLTIEKLAVAVLASALASLGDTFSLRAFASSGRDDVRLTRIKDFAEPYGRAAITRLSGLQPGLSTRLGTAMRHVGAELAGVRSTRKILLVLTDGAPSDIDVPDPMDLVEDARRATLWLRGLGIDTFGIVLDAAGSGAGAAVFGRTNHLPVGRIEDLPNRLSELYFRVAR